MTFFQMRRIFNRHAATNIIVCGLNFIFSESQMCQQIKSNRIDLLIIKFQNVFTKFFSQNKLVECKTDVKNTRQLQFDVIDHFIGKTFFLEGIAIDIR